MSINSGNSAQLQLVLDFIDAINTNNQEKAKSCLSEDFVNYVLPKTLPENMTKPRTKEGYLATMNEIALYLKDLKIILDEDEVIEEPGKLAACSTSTAISHTGVPYQNEYMFNFHMTTDPKDGRLKITLWKEMVDSLYTTTFFAEEGKRMANQKFHS